MKLKDKHFSIGIWSQNHEKLAKWYQDVMGFKVKEKMDLPDDTYIEFEFGPTDHFFIGGRKDKISGKNKDPYRMIIGFHVESITKAYKELAKKKVTFIAKPFAAPPGGF
ncbi:MAG TPA: VOC family protein [Candidatus Saccharimonadales bacterium]|nr:VOC family protein [Candidatus Saccharimonadales bacterium]